MNYKKHYIKLIRNALNRTQSQDSYYERHHVFPTSIFGKNNFIVKLTAKEHFIAHFLLWKYYKNKKDNINCQKMACAFFMMTWNNTGKRYTSRNFIIARQAVAENNRGDNNPSKKIESRKKISESKTGKPRPDMNGKRFFGADEEAIKKGIQKMADSKRGISSWNKGLTYTVGPCPDEKKKKISESRKNTKEKFIKMSKDEFQIWMSKFSKYRKDGGLNPNITRAISWRGENISEYYPNRFDE